MLSAMKTRTKFNLYPSIDAFSNINVNTFISLQDIIHIGTKLRNRLLNSSIVLYLGTHIVSIAHINQLIERCAKEIHGLVRSDVFPEDRQNYRSLEKMMEDRVLNALAEYVADSEATVEYLKICKMLTSSFLENNLTPIERIENIWYALYFLRIWRKWITTHNEYSLKENFISSNAFNCVEINAHALIELIVKLRSAGLPDLFLPWMFSSQPCEHMFRSFRSMGTINFTKINFTLHELFQMVSRQEMIQKTIHAHIGLEFPRQFQSENDSSDPTYTVQFPTNEEIVNGMIDARSRALESAKKFGIILNADDITTTELQFSRERVAESLADDMYYQTVEEDEELDEEDKVDEEFSEILCEENASPDANELASENPEENAEISNTQSPTQSTSNMVDVFDSDGSKKSIRKSTFLWMLAENKNKLSSDRLKRVQGSSSQNLGPASKKQKTIDVFDNGVNLLKCNDIKIGDWALFKMTRPSSSIENQNGQLIGNVLGFRRLDEKGRPKQFKTTHVSTETNPNENIEVLAALYICQGNKLERYNSKQIILKEQYRATIKPPIVKKEESTSKISYHLKFDYSELEEFF